MLKVIRNIITTYIIFFLAATLWTVPAKAQVVDKYISKYKSIAMQLSAEYGIPVAIILGVAIVESSAGKGPAVKRLNNHFGIVGHNELKVDSNHHKSRYKQYKSAEDSYRDFCKMISRKKFYDKIKYNNDPSIWVRAMSLAHYSELPLIWQKKILSTIANYNLNSFCN
jgi:uncharacterized FlgJ-related protein